MKAIKRIGLILGATLLLCVVIGFSVMFSALQRAAHRTDALRTSLQQKAATAQAHVMQDQAELAGHWLVARRAGNADASPVLNARAGWRDHSRDATGKPGVPPALVAQLERWGPRWHEHIAEANIEGLDLAWMAQLATFDVWDLEADGSPMNRGPWNLATVSLPDFMQLQLAAKARLIQGLRTGQPAVASAEVRELARLCASTELLIGEMIGLALARMEQKARAAAAASGADTTGWPEATPTESDHLGRAVWGAVAYFQLLQADAAVEDKLVVGRCAALQEGLGSALLLRGALGERYATRYTELSRALQGAPCRLKNLRRAWTTGESEMPVSGAMFCTINGSNEDSSLLCQLPAGLFQLPFVKETVGETLLSVGGPDWLDKYFDKKD